MKKTTNKISHKNQYYCLYDKNDSFIQMFDSIDDLCEFANIESSNTIYKMSSVWRKENPEKAELISYEETEKNIYGKDINIINYSQLSLEWAYNCRVENSNIYKGYKLYKFWSKVA